MNSIKYSGPSIIYSNLNITLPDHENYGKFIVDKLLENQHKVALRLVEATRDPRAGEYLAQGISIAIQRGNAASVLGTLPTGVDMDQINGDTGDQITYGEMAQKVVNIVSALTELKVRADDVIGICSENRTEFLTTAIAGMCTEAVVTFINCAYSKDEILHTLKISKPKYLFLSPNTFKSYYQTIRKLDFISKFFVFGSSQSNGKVMSFTELVSTNKNIDTFQVKTFNGAEKTALILYSSGTTGLPKGAKLSHRNLIISGQSLSSKISNYVSLTIAPWTNTVGILLTMNEIINGQTIVYLTRFDEKIYIKCIEKYKVGYILAVPPLVVLLSKSELISRYDVSSVELIFCGGAPLSLSVITEVKKRFPNLRNVLQGYGMTEASGGITDESDSAPRQGSVGRICDGLIIKVVDVETRKLLGPNMPGEICLKGPGMFQGYIGRDSKEDFDEDGFYNTGDIAYYDEDGYFYIVERIKELIKYKAWQVAPSELEAILQQHPGVKDTGVIGAPDALAGELPTAFVVKQPDAAVTEKELLEFVKSKVSPWKQLRGGVRFITQIPKNGSGKILRRKLRELLTKPVSKL